MAGTGDCSICLQNLLHPAQLPCGHIFCFLCIKGCALHKRRCPMCRVRFSARFFDDPKLVKTGNLLSSTSCQDQDGCDGVGATRSTSLPVPKMNSDSSSQQYVWFYEGFGGWWQYDERTCREIEESYMKQLLLCEVTIAGYVYTIDLTNMTQFRKDQSGRRRRIKRDLSTCEKKGIAGIKIADVQPVQPSSEDPKVQSQSDEARLVGTSSTIPDKLEQSLSRPVAPDVVDRASPTCSASNTRSRSRLPRQAHNSSNSGSDNLQHARPVTSSQPPQSDPNLRVSQTPRTNHRRHCRSLTRQV